MNYKDYLKEKQQRVVVSTTDRIVTEDMVTVEEAKKACELAVSELAEQLCTLPFDKAFDLIDKICSKPVEVESC